MRNVQRLDPDKHWGELSVVVTDDAGISVMNAEYFQKEEPTDVICFTYAPLPGENQQATGEIIVNVERAMDVGSVYRGPSHEFAMYIAHGCDHLAGANDDTPARRARMIEREEGWLADPACRKLIDSLLPGESPS